MMIRAAMTLLILWASPIYPAERASAPANAEQLRAIVLDMKVNPRGPFARLRWFCADGTVLPPRAYACAEHGGGRQHGEWSADALALRAAGYPVANVLAALGPEDFDDSEAADVHFRMLLLEQFLYRIDDGWILRRARYYRGAFQVEQEEQSAAQLLQDLVNRPQWLTYRYPLLVEAARLLPHGARAIGASEIRNLASAINRADPGFSELRNKIHGRPEAGDAASVRDYASTRGKGELADQYASLADAIDAASKPPDVGAAVDEFAARMPDQPILPELQRLAAVVEGSGTAAEKLDGLSVLMTVIRDDMANLRDVAALDLLLVLEGQVFQTVQALSLETLTRRQSLDLMMGLARASYAVGLLTGWEWENVRISLGSLQQPEVAFTDYRAQLRYLQRVPGWAARRLALYFETEIHHLSFIEPIVVEYIPDRMRGSPLLYYSRLLNPLAADAMRLAGVRQEMFGEQVSTGLRALNPGVGRGVLRTLDELANLPGGTADSIVLVPAGEEPRRAQCGGGRRAAACAAAVPGAPGGGCFQPGGRRAHRPG